jgi:hypothetical protein
LTLPPLQPPQQLVRPCPAQERPPPAERGRQLALLVDEIKRHGRGRDYDCIIGVSGGVDSSYVAVRASELGLRLLALHVDNGWNSDKAVSNIKRILDPLHIDLSTKVLNWKEFRALQLAFLRASTPDSEIPTDHAIVATFFEASKRYRINYCLSGINFRTEGIHVRAWSQGHLDSRYIRSVYQQFTGARWCTSADPVTTLVRASCCTGRATFSPHYLDYDKQAQTSC